MEKRHELTLSGVKSYKLTDYVEKLCASEKIKIKTCYEDSYSFLNTDRDNSWFTQQVRDGDNIVIESNDYNRLKFVEHLYLKRVAIIQQLKKVECEINTTNHINNNLYTTDSGVRVEIRHLGGTVPNHSVQNMIENWNKDMADNFRLSTDGVTFRTFSPAELGDIRRPHLKATYIPKVPIQKITFTATVGNEYYRGPNGKIIELTSANSDTWKSYVRLHYERVSPPETKPSFSTRATDFIYKNYYIIQSILLALLVSVILIPPISYILTNVLK